MVGRTGDRDCISTKRTSQWETYFPRETFGKNMAIQFTLSGLLRCLRKLLSIGFTLLFCDILLRVSFVLLFFVLLPFFIIYDHVIPSTILFIKSVRPILDAFFGRLLPSLFAFVLSLIPPVLIFFFTKYFLMPVSIKVFQLTW
ncbi:uncharacterized protein PHA67_022317 [Liasis olivaceus]